MKFEYRTINNLTSPFSKKAILRPIIPISIKYGERRLRYEALIDSGADFIILPVGLAEILNIKAKNSKEIYFSGVDGEIIKGIIAEISLEVRRGDSYTTKVVFAKISGTIGILGELGFFDQFIVSFDLIKKEIELKPRKQKLYK